MFFDFDSLSAFLLQLQQREGTHVFVSVLSIALRDPFLYNIGSAFPKSNRHLKVRFLDFFSTVKSRLASWSTVYLLFTITDSQLRA